MTSVQEARSSLAAIGGGGSILGVVTRKPQLDELRLRYQGAGVGLKQLKLAARCIWSPCEIFDLRLGV